MTDIEWLLTVAGRTEIGDLSPGRARTIAANLKAARDAMRRTTAVIETGERVWPASLIRAHVELRDALARLNGEK